MARRPAIDNESILEATRQLILEKGLDVKTSEIAKSAGISEGSIFSRFSSKNQLIQEALFSVINQDWLSQIDFHDTNTDEAQVFQEILLKCLHHFRVAMPLHMAAVAHFGAIFSFPHMMEQGIEPPPLRYTNHIKTYLDHLVIQHKIQTCDTEVLASMFLGSVMIHVFLEMNGNHKANPHADQQFAAETLRLLQNGIKPQNSHISTSSLSCQNTAP